MTRRHRLVVVGGGPAGLAAARAYREARGGGTVAIVTDEHRVPYRRPPLTKELLRGEANEAELPLESERWLAEQRIELVCGRAVELARDRRTITLSGGRELPYESCVLATGAEPSRLPVPGTDDPAVRVLRSLDHLRDLNARLHEGDPVTVIGSGFIGCEIAASLRRRGHPVTLISDERAPNEERLGPWAASQIATWLQADGVTLHAGRAVRSIERRGESLTVCAEDIRVSSPVIVMATGVAPRSELAQAAGLDVRDGQVCVSAAMRTSDSHILAAGDVARAENLTAGRALRVEHWGDALAQGRVAGRVVAGKRAGWDDVPGFWSAIGEHTLKYVAWGDGHDHEHHEADDDGRFTVFYEMEGRLVGVLTHRRDEDYERAAQAIKDGARWRR